MKQFFSLYVVLIIFFQISFNVNVAAAKLKYSIKDVQALNKFRSKIRDVINTNTSDYSNSNEYLITWIQDREYNLEKAEEKLRKSLKWRRDNGIDQLLQDEIIPSLQTKFPYSYVGNDKEGSPTFGVPFGKWKIRKYVLGGQFNLALKQVLTIYENATQLVRESLNAGKDVTQWNMIGNLAGFNVREHACLSCMPLYLEMTLAYENNYPQTAKNVVIINSPKIFDRILQLVKPLMSSNSLKAMKVFSVDKAEYQKFLNSFFDLKKLSIEYGGL